MGAVCRLVHEADRSNTTMEWETARRTGKVFLDSGLNRRAASFAAAYSARARWGAPVSTPFAWDELETVDARAFTIETIGARLARAGDPFRAVVDDTGVSLAGALETLGIATDEPHS